MGVGVVVGFGAAGFGVAGAGVVGFGAAGLGVVGAGVGLGIGEIGVGFGLGAAGFKASCFPSDCLFPFGLVIMPPNPVVSKVTK